jgi:ethanolamine-phosphate cytidylyltransferase
MKNLPYGLPDVVYHGPTAFVPMSYDPYSAARQLDIFRQIGDHEFRNVNAGEIVQRILKSRDMYVERQRVKAAKAVGEEAQQLKELLEKEAKST